MGRRRARGPEHLGVLVVDKPLGPTSHDVVQTVRRAAGQSRVGHTGTLDPAASGVLVVCLGRATKLVQFLQAGTKTYAARMVLGVETDSQDAQGEVVQTIPASHVDEQAVCEVLTRYQGEITQVPPMVSAVKVDGERLHAKARRGEEVERAARQVTIHDLLLDGFHVGDDPDHPEVSFLVTCTAGTYVRTLAHDIGQDLAVGGSLVALRRLANGPFGADEAHDLDTIVRAGSARDLDSLLVDPADAVRRALPILEVTDGDLAARLVQGAKLPASQVPAAVSADAGAPIGVEFAGQLLGIYPVPSGADVRPALVWTRPDELRAGERGAASSPVVPQERP